MTTTEQTTKTLTAMTREVLEWCQSKGWYDKPVSFGEAMALLHSEVSEALEAWRIWGTDDGTAGSAINPGGDPGAKPEGVGSEFADILIRLLDDCGRFDVDLETEVALYVGVHAISSSFLENMNALHDLISFASGMHAVGDGDYRPQFADIYEFLRLCCAEYDIDLTAEYTRKMTYNRTRPYRHGKRQ